MLVSVVLLTLGQAVPLARLGRYFCGLSTAVPAVWSPATAAMPRRSAAAAVAADTGGVSRVDDIEELPAGLAEGYRRHQASYHEFTRDEVREPLGNRPVLLSINAHDTQHVHHSPFFLHLYFRACTSKLVRFLKI